MKIRYLCFAKQFWSLNLKLAYSFPAKQHMHFVCNSYTRIMFYKQCSYWTTGYPFPKFWWSLLLVAYVWPKNGNLIVMKRVFNRWCNRDSLWFHFRNQQEANFWKCWLYHPRPLNYISAVASVLLSFQLDQFLKNLRKTGEVAYKP